MKQLKRLWQISGGLPLAGYRQQSRGGGLRQCDVPSRLVYKMPNDEAQAGLKVRIGQRVLRGQVLHDKVDDRTPPIHAATSGFIKAIQPAYCSESNQAGLELTLESDGKDESIAFEATYANFRQFRPEALRQHIHTMGLLGLGGGVFPTAAKLAAGLGRIHTLILNGAECEPYISCDEILLRERPEEVILGAEILRFMLGAEICLLAIESDRHQAIPAIERALARLKIDSVKLVLIPVHYPTGGERQLIRLMTGQEVPIGGLPADLGIHCQNVGTVYAAYRAIVHGEPLVSRMVTVTGRGVRNPQNLEVRLGTSVKDLITECGGYTEEAEFLILGGAMMGKAIPSDDMPVTASVNCVLVAGKTEFQSLRQEKPCIRCGECSDACPAGLLPQQLYWQANSSQFDKLLDSGLSSCIECGCCDVVCPSHIPLTQMFKSSKAQIKQNTKSQDKAERARARFESRQLRQEREQREILEAAQRKKHTLGNSAAPEIRRAIERAKLRRQEKPIENACEEQAREASTPEPPA